MKRKWTAAVCVLGVAALLTGCSGGGQQNVQSIPEVTQYLGPSVEATATPVPIEPNLDGAVSDAGTPASDGVSIFESNPYDVPTDAFTADDAMNEENMDPAVAVETTYYPYAGSTPIPLDPVDMPTPTPRPALTFNYVPYEVNSVGLSFEAPAGWVPDESVSDMYTLTEPAEQIKEGQAGVITLYAVPVNNNYTESNLKSEVKQRLDTIGSTGFAVWDPSLTATRYLLGAKGVYANYTGTLASGVEVGGRIHCTCVNNVLYCLQITYPLGYKDDYLNVFSQVRQTLKRLQ
ncbi:MAG: hypothetical protein PHY12_07305 [Eubacteriales bacterium]|nr:hypothetical protein [Eubacteriales bacterium]